MRAVEDPWSFIEARTHRCIMDLAPLTVRRPVQHLDSELMKSLVLISEMC